jgi:formate dehydrogenase iron-sulfur subunit
LLIEPRVETVLFWIEILAGVVAPIALLAQASTRRSPTRLFWSAALVIAGVVFNRFNVSLLALAHEQGSAYLPHPLEFAITVGIVAAGLVAYWLVAHFLPLFGGHDQSSHVPSQ